MEAAATAIFLLSGFFLLYSLVLYPVVIWMMARLRPRPVIKRFEPRTVSVLLPVHNGGKWLGAKLDSLLDLDYDLSLLEILVISDGSTDETASIARQYEGRGVRLLEIEKSGKAVALNHGLAAAQGEILFFTDVRQRLERDSLRLMIANFADPQVGAVCGELIILDGATQEEASVGLYWKIEKWIRRQLSSMGTLLVVTGCLYAVRRHLAEPLPAGILGDDIFMPQSVLRKGARVLFEDGARAYDYPTARDVEFWRKVRTLAGIYQYVGRWGLGPHKFHFFSYKVSRLLLPYALIAIAVSTLFLPPGLRLIAILAQSAFYALAAMDSWMPEKGLVKRLSSPARTFCMLMKASLWATSVLFVPAAALWKTTQVRATSSAGR